MALDLPDGSRRLVDTPPLTAECAAFLGRAEAGRVVAHTSLHVLREAVHKVMLAEASLKFGRPLAGLVGWLGRHPERLGELGDFRRAAEAMIRMRHTILPTDAALLVEAADVSREAGLLTNDATSVALMRRHGLADLASNDDDFAAVAGVTLWRPR